MTLAAILTLLTVLAVLGTLVFTRIAPDAVLITALAFLMVAGVLGPVEALAGFANPGLLTIAALYVVAVALRETGALQWVARTMLGEPKGLRNAQFRLLAPVALLSAFLNNTTVVAMFIPAVQQWARRLRIPSSKLLMILSYGAILAGTCTLIGTSTNLVVNGLLQRQGHPGLGIFDLAWVGVPALVVGGLYLLAFSGRLLPGREGVVEQLAEVRQYAVEVEVEAGGPLVGRSIADAGLRNLPNGYLAEIDRGESVLPAVSPDTRLEAGDVLVFVGSPECAKDLRQVRGLTPARAGVHKLDIDHRQRVLIEAVLSPDFPGLGQTIKEIRFRTRYRAAVLSVFRAGERSRGKLGDIRLQTGDTLLLEADQAFVEQYRARRDFLLVSAMDESTPPDYARAPRALIILAAMVAVAAFELVTMLEAAWLAAVAMLLTGCVGMGRARSGINLSVLVVIGASLGLGAALTQTGLATGTAEILTAGITSPLMALVVIYLLTVAFTEVITNNAAAVMMFTIAVEVASALGVSPMPFVVAVMFAASAAFMTPIGYHTNLMVMGPGGYRFGDYVRLGAPLSLTVFVVCMLLIPRVWPF